MNNLLTTLSLARELCVTDEEKQEFDALLDEALNYKSPNICHWTPGEPLTEDCLFQKPMELSDDDFLDFASDKFNDEEWQRLCDLLAE